MTTKLRTRGSKRTCQNEACGSRFYDLQRTTFQCPICASPFDVARALAEERPEPSRSSSRWPKQGRRFAPSPVEAPEAVEPELADPELADEDDTSDAFAGDGAEVVLEDDDTDATPVSIEFDGDAREPDAT